eukprot:TRINITY_DN37270_c0_g1_i1.p1 TRINITY_DN37270_c0_g1~~TRINITY_DN37270_c0_g1_i1.p1  ORF type:complete len:604 (-),score=104.76 TRINITY_DN37270_c0_g1_i1:283-1965(-)
MAEVFEWPRLEGNSWEAMPQVSILLDSEHLNSEEQVSAFFDHFDETTFWQLQTVGVEESSNSDQQSSAHHFDLSLRKVVSRALAEAPKELAKIRSVLAKQWGARKAALVSQFTAATSEIDSKEENGSAGGVALAALANEMEGSFLQSCVADVRLALTADGGHNVGEALKEGGGKSQKARQRGKQAQAKDQGNAAKKDKAKKPSVSLLGPPYRWLQMDCKCYFTENLYVKEVDAYFKSPGPNATEAEFWAANEIRTEYDDESTKRRIFEVATAEVSRRSSIPDTYRMNANQAYEQYKPKYGELFPPHASKGQILAVPSAPIQGQQMSPAVAPGLEAAEVFMPEFLEAWRSAMNGDSLPATSKHVHDLCYENPCFTRDFCAKLKSEVQNFKGQSLPHQRPNSMNRNGVILNEIGLGPLMDRIIMIYLLPICKKLYPEYLVGGLDAHHSFIVDYGVGKDTSLGVHDDNSEVTVNIALSEDYSGAELVLYHRARVEHPQQLQKTPYRHRVGLGTMLLHPGEMLHEVLPLTEGERQGLIIWLRSDDFRRKSGCALCRRSDRLIYA